MIESEHGNAVSPEVLLSEIASGNKGYEQKLVSNYWKGLYFVLNRQSQNPDLAADLTQEALLVVIVKARAGEITTPSALPAYIRQTGVNLLIAHYRKEQRRKTDDTDDIDVQFSDAAPELAQQMNTENLAALVDQVLRELPTERDKQILMRFYKYGEEKAVICQALDLSSDHFDRVLFRARQRFKQILRTKLNLDIQQVSLAHLLSFAALFGTAQIAMADSEHILFDEMRDYVASVHLVNSDTEVLPSSLATKSSISLRRLHDTTI